jgi:photosynthetic reaction center cytochrome c subunit
VDLVLRVLLGVVVVVAAAEAFVFARSILFRSERPSVGTAQLGYRGTGLVNVYNPRTREELVAANQVPHSVPYGGEVGEKAGEVYENVKVLGDVSAGEFTRLMVNITEWVAPEQGCAACHDTENFAADTLYTKVVARRMLEMTRHINANWTKHVQQTGVTCYTCHRGQLVPPSIWFNDPGPAQAGGYAQAPAGQNHPAAAAALGGASLPFDPFTPFLDGDRDVRVQSTTALRVDNRHSIKQAEWTYALMMHMSQALGVNCDYCHNTRAFRDWAQSPPQRTTAWHGIRMVRDLNNNYLGPLQTVLPTNRLGAAGGDPPKANCATCHNGVYKPLFGVSMAQGFPELTGATPAVQ